MSLYTSVIRPFLFTLPPERAQSLAEIALRLNPASHWLNHAWSPKDDKLCTTLAGIPLRSPVGLAAGYDKNCNVLGPIMSLGFGYIVGGTVTLHPRPGNPSPRLLRLPKQEALVNALGFPSKGLNHVESAIRELNNRPSALFISISGLSVEEFLECHQRLEPLVEAIELNISSPNTAGIRIFQEQDKFTELIEKINQQRTKSIFIKLPPYGTESEKVKVHSLIKICVNLGVSGITVANTKPVEEQRLRVGRGGLSGQPLLHNTTKMVEEIRSEASNNLAINACGGISSGKDAVACLEKGADTVQIYTGLIYSGPALVSRINNYIVQTAVSRSLSSVREFYNT
jgi:dihydroorotate dehydrogenase